MGKRVLLLSTNRCATPDVVFPLGLSFLNAALRAAGHEVRWLDCLVDLEPLRDVLIEYRPDFVGVSVRNIDDVLIRKRETYFEQLGDICATVRDTRPCPVILGGSGFSIFPAPLLAATRADYGIHGEGETSLVELIAALSQGEEVARIPGLVYRRGQAIAVNPPSATALVQGLGAADYPPRHVEHYLRNAGMLNVQTQRGCAHGCCYCTYPVIEGHMHRSRPPELVADEMARLESLGAKYAFIVDSVFNSSPRHVEQMCEAMMRRKLGLRWGCFLRPQGLTPELLALMARAGLAHIEFGSDSFCDQVLESYSKRLTFEDILNSSELARQQQIDCCHFLICGGPGETARTLQITYEHSLALKSAIILAVVGMRVYPGTALHTRALQEGRLPPEANLLSPTYYLSPALTEAEVFGRLQDFAQRSPHWVIGDPTPAYARLVERLRARGVPGPLWSYFAMVQRLWPQTASGPALA
jgi:radical SAM superfamily enzyme YgiQ (UPF0313 family)